MKICAQCKSEWNGRFGRRDWRKRKGTCRRMLDQGFNNELFRDWRDHDGRDARGKGMDESGKCTQGRIRMILIDV